jgi:hypothetical protein
MSNETVAIPDYQPASSFQLDLVEAMVEVTKAMWDCSENLARKVCRAKLGLRVSEIGNDPDTLQAWFEEWRMEILFSRA